MGCRIYNTYILHSEQSIVYICLPKLSTGLYRNTETQTLDCSTLHATQYKITNAMDVVIHMHVYMFMYQNM